MFTGCLQSRQIADMLTCLSIQELQYIYDHMVLTIDDIGLPTKFSLQIGHSSWIELLFPKLISTSITNESFFEWIDSELWIIHSMESYRCMSFGFEHLDDQIFLLSRFKYDSNSIYIPFPTKDFSNLCETVKHAMIHFRLSFFRVYFSIVNPRCTLSKTPKNHNKTITWQQWN